MNILQSCDPRMKSIQENSILSFNAASKFPIDFIEFDVQVFPFFFFFYKCSCLVSKKRKVCSRFKNSKIKLCSVNSGKIILNTFIIRSIRVKFQDSGKNSCTRSFLSVSFRREQTQIQHGHVYGQFHVSCSVFIGVFTIIFFSFNPSNSRSKTKDKEGWKKDSSGRWKNRIRINSILLNRIQNLYI